MENLNAVGWFEIYVNDMKRARTFYETVFQVELEDLSNPTSDELIMKSFPSANTETEMAPGAAGALVQMEGVEPGGMGTIVYFSSEDCAVEEARVEEAGGSVARSKMSIGEYGFITLAHDTEGNMFGIHSVK